MNKDKLKECKKHGLVRYVLEGRGYYRCTQCRYDAIAKRRRKMKLLLIEYKGGSCEHCGYDKCLEALEFHHKDPSEKDFAISSGSCCGFEKLKVEVDKCLMLCANCHREEHVRLRLE